MCGIQYYFERTECLRRVNEERNTWNSFEAMYASENERSSMAHRMHRNLRGKIMQSSIHFVVFFRRFCSEQLFWSAVLNTHFIEIKSLCMYSRCGDHGCKYCSFDCESEILFARACVNHSDNSKVCAHVWASYKLATIYYMNRAENQRKWIYSNIFMRLTDSMLSFRHELKISSEPFPSIRTIASLFLTAAAADAYNLYKYYKLSEE